MSDTVLLEIDSRAVGLLVPESGCLVLRSAVTEFAYLDGFPFRDCQRSYLSIGRRQTPMKALPV